MKYIFEAIMFLCGILAGVFLNEYIDRNTNQENRTIKRSRSICSGNVLKLVNGLLWLWIFVIYGFRIESIVFALCASVLLVIAVIDFKTYEIPSACNILIAILGLIRLLFHVWDWKNYVIGFFAVSGFFYILYWITKGRGIGGGDIKLMAASGLLLGWKEIVFAMAVGSIAGAVIHTFRMKISKEDRVLAFGPYLALGILVAMLYGQQCISWYLSLFL